MLKPVFRCRVLIQYRDQNGNERGIEEMEATIMKMLSVTALCACLKGAMPDHNRNVEFIYIVVMLMILINYVRSLISF